MITLLLTLLASSVFAKPVERSLFQPQVKTTNGTVLGAYSLLGVDTFLGIPFAQPPVGDLRLRAPQPVKTNWGTIQATAHPKACPQFPIQVDTSDQTASTIAAIANNPILQSAINVGEDCLTLSVFRPFGATSQSNYPVVFWIFGGGFELGWSGMYDFTQWVQQSVSNGNPIVAVAVNYRVGGFGFLPGSDLSNEHNTNLGLRDQRLGLQWVADNIRAFGGDPSKVTIWGESAGAMSVCDHTLINNGDNTYNGKALFRAAIMNSGSVVPADPVTAPQAQAIYDAVVDEAGCSSAADRLACLRAADFDTFATATQSVPGLLGYRSLDLSYLPRPDPSDSFLSVSPALQVASGKFAKVPTIVGDLVDEGTLFALSQHNISTNQDLVDYVATYFPGDANAQADVAQLASYYPDDPLGGQPDGSPFGTGPLYNLYPQQKRLAAILGDLTFTLSRRIYLDALGRNGVTAWSYMADYLQDFPVLGTFHASDLLVLFNPLSTYTIPHQSFQNYYLNFITNLDPNKNAGGLTQTTWPQYDSVNRKIITIGAIQNTQAVDNFRSEAASFLATKGTTFSV